MEIRLAEKTDLNQLARMRWEYWVEGGSDPAKLNEEAFVTRFVESLNSELNIDWFVWCAIEHDVVLSHVYIQQIQKVPKPSAPADAFGYITNVYTRPTHRNSGIGSEVMKHVKLWAQELDLEFLVLWPSESSMSFWHRIDFSADDPLVFEIRPYVN